MVGKNIGHGGFMIEIKNIVKTYRPKKGGEVKALDDVSLKFPEKGLVFILGKSGSGKSTLLNVMGGLDTADSGEIIIKGKSSKEFSTGDFDSYRNTYLGFIFQEYNILEDFNVGANIALALKLQGAKATDEKINEILDEVGLSGYGKRKPNELSGGQKQRVAIARALVKNPEIIMADEPTGALDSGTGIQVFDTLKKLSKDKLVIVVSHDREFAESYGDRVIELKDGKVISDIEKHRIDAEVEEGGAENYKGKLLRFPKGYRLTADDVKRINEYLERDEAYLSLDEKVNADVKTASHIDEDGKMESFAPTDENAIKISDDKPFRLIKSRMPVKESFKMGVSGMKTKPFRLIITIFLCFVCFAMFGIVDSFAAYDSKTAIVNSMQDSGIKYTTFRKTVLVDDIGAQFFTEKRMSDADVENLKNKTGIEFLPVLSESGSGYYSGGIASVSGNFLKDATSRVYDGSVSGIVEVKDESTLKKHNLSLMAGRLPERDDEIAISDFVFDCFKKWGYAYVDEKGVPDESKNIEASGIKNAADFVNAKPNLKIAGSAMNGTFKIVGVVKTGYDYSRYAALDKTVGSDDDALDSFMLQSQFSSEHNSAFSGLLFCGKDFIKNYLAYDGVGGEIYDRAILQSEEINGKAHRMYMGGDYRHYFTTADYAGTVFFDSGKTTLSDNEIVLEVKQLINALKNVYYDNAGICDKLDGIENSSDNEEIKATLSPLVKDAKIKMQCGGTYNPYITKILTIKGYFVDPGDGTVDKSFIGVSDSLAAEIKNAPVGKYARAISGEKLSKSDLEKVVEFSMKSEDGVKYSLVNYVVSAENMVGSIIKEIAKILLYVGIGVFVFAVILFMTYISASISYKKREIGILRAVGARSSDVFGIFFNEALVISLIVFVLATIGSGVVVSVVNSSMHATYGLPITLLSYGIREIGIILLGCIATALFASFIPVLRIARKKPVDAIKNR